MTVESPRIELDRSTVSVGGNVNGKVVFDSGKTPPEVNVVLLWRTTGDFDPEEKETARCEARTSGGVARFCLPVSPAGPMTYSGQTFSVNWFVRAVTEPPVEEPLVVTPAVLSS